MRRRTFRLLYLMIVVLALIIRLWGLGQLPHGIYWDEAAILADAKKVVTTGSDMHELSPWHLIYPSYGDYKLAPYIWATTLAVKILGVNYLALRLPSAIAGVASVVLAGLIAKIIAKQSHLDSPKQQLWQLSAMATVAICPWSVLFSRAAFEGHLGQMLLGLAVYLLLLSWSQPKSKTRKQLAINIILLIITGFVGGLAFWTYFSVRFVWPVIAALIGIYYLLDTRNWPRFLGSNIIIGLIFALMLWAMAQDPFYQASNQLRLSTPSILNNQDLPHQVNHQRLLSGNSLFSRLVFSQKLTQIQQLAINYARHLDFGYLYLHGDSNLRHSTGNIGLFYLIWAPFTLAGLIYLLAKHPSVFCLFFGWWLIGLLPASVPTLSVPHSLRSLNSLLPACLITSCGLSLFIHYILYTKHQSKNRQLFKYCLGIACLGMLLTEVAGFAWDYIHVYPHRADADTAWESANDELAAILMHEQEHYKQVYAVNLDGFLYLWYLNQPQFDMHDLNTTYQSDNYTFRTLGKVNFGLDETVPAEGELFFLGERQKIEDYLSQVPHRDRQDKYSLRAYNHDYIGVSVVILPDATK
ncbi:hypothetical protein IJJ08_04825 [bacterium]|nr:hypothetical protein [bacterium]